MKRNLVYEALRVMRLELRSHPRRDLLQRAMEDMLCSNVHRKDERKRKVAYHRHTDGDSENKSLSGDEMPERDV